jgi:hypothetical protein
MTIKVGSKFQHFLLITRLIGLVVLLISLPHRIQGTILHSLCTKIIHSGGFMILITLSYMT